MVSLKMRCEICCAPTVFYKRVTSVTDSNIFSYFVGFLFSFKGEMAPDFALPF